MQCQDVHCVDWNAIDTHLLATGSADHAVNIWDMRKLDKSGKATPVYVLEGHTNGITSLQWYPGQSSVLASGASDSLINVWDISRIQSDSNDTTAALVFQHSGHRGEVTDFQWNATEKWTMLSVSDESQPSGGGTVQAWRVNDMVYTDEEKVLQE